MSAPRNRRRKRCCGHQRRRRRDISRRLEALPASFYNVAPRDPAVARRPAFEIYDLFLHRLYRAGPDPQRPVDHDGPQGLFRLFPGSAPFVAATLCRAVRRHVSFWAFSPIGFGRGGAIFTYALIGLFRRRR